VAKVIIMYDLFATVNVCDLEWLGHSRSSAVSLFDRVHTTFRSNYISNLHRFRCIASYSSKIAYFCTPRIWSPLGVTVWKLLPDNKCRYATMQGRPANPVISIQYWHVTDRRTDRQTLGHSTYRDSMTSWSKNVYKYNYKT